MDETTKEKLNWQRLLITTGLVLATAAIIGGGTWYYMDQNEKAQTKSYSDSVASFQEQVNELKAVKTTPSSTATTPIVTASKTETETITTFCQSGGSNYKVSNIQHVTNTNGDFVLCSVGYTDMPSGFVIYAKKINNNWTEIFKGQENPSSALANQYQIPHSLYMFSASDDSMPDGVKNWEY